MAVDYCDAVFEGGSRGGCPTCQSARYEQTVRVWAAVRRNLEGLLGTRWSDSEGTYWEVIEPSIPLNNIITIEMRGPNGDHERRLVSLSVLLLKWTRLEAP